MLRFLLLIVILFVLSTIFLLIYFRNSVVATPIISQNNLPKTKTTQEYLTANQSLSEVTSRMHDKHLSSTTCEKFKELLKDPKQIPLIRNNAANALVGQEKKDPELWRLFLKMAQDPKEDEVWRDYCLQFLAACVPFASEPKTVTDYLATVAREEG